MKHIAWFDFLGELVGQKTIKTHCGIRVKYGTHTNTVTESDCVDCIHAVAISARLIENVLNVRRDDLWDKM